MRTYQANEMIYMHLWNNSDLQPSDALYTSRVMKFRTPVDEAKGETYDTLGISVNVEEGVVFLENREHALKLFGSEEEVDLFVDFAQRIFDEKVDMGKGFNFVFGYGGSRAYFKERNNTNIIYIPIVFPDDEKFQNPRYKEKVIDSLMEKGAIYIRKNDGERYLAVIQRKNKPRDLKPFIRFIDKQYLSVVPSQKSATPKEPATSDSMKTIDMPSWLGQKINAQGNGNVITIQAAVKRMTEKAVLIAYNGQDAWLPKSKISIK